VSRPALRLIEPPRQRVHGFLSPRVKYGRGVTLTTRPHLVPRSRTSMEFRDRLRFTYTRQIIALLSFSATAVNNIKMDEVKIVVCLHSEQERDYKNTSVSLAVH
jgi:hypothetical protein